MVKRNANGQGTIRKRINENGKVSWEGRVVIEIEGVKKRKSVYGKTQKEAREKLQEIIAKSQRGMLIETSDIILEEWVLTWLTVSKKVTLKQTTYENYMIFYETHIKGSKIGKIPINKLKITQLQAFYNEKSSSSKSGKKGLSASSVRHINILISGALDDAVRKGMIDKNPAKLVIKPKIRQKEIEPLKDDEIVRFLNEAKKERLYALYVLEVFTGLRRGEILALQWDDIDVVNERIRISKTLSRVMTNEQEKAESGRKYKLILTEPKTEKSKRTLPINEETIRVLNCHKDRQMNEKLENKDIYQDNDLVFALEDGNFISPRALLDNYHNILIRAGIEKKRFHDLRHTFASILINENENPKVIQELLGHSTITTTMDVYSHVLESTKKKSVDKIYNKILNTQKIDENK